MRNAFFTAAFAMAMLNCHAASAQSLYYNNVVNTSCVSNTSCTFTFPAVTSTNANGVLTVTKVSCRIVTASTPSSEVSNISYIALSKSSNSSKLEFLNYITYIEAAAGNLLEYANVVDANTLFFVQVGASPTIVINTNGPIAAPNSTTDQPTCSVAGTVQ